LSAAFNTVGCPPRTALIDITDILEYWHTGTTRDMDAGRTGRWL